MTQATLPMPGREPPAAARTALRLVDPSAPPVEFVVEGKPLTWARAQRGRYGSTYTPADREAHMGIIAAAWRAAGREPFHRDQPLLLQAEFVFVRPSSHFGTGANRNLLKASAPTRPGKGTNGGDLDNLVKIVKDALTAVAYHDDTQIAFLIAEKRFATGTEMSHSRLLLRTL